MKNKLSKNLNFYNVFDDLEYNRFAMKNHENSAKS